MDAEALLSTTAATLAAALAGINLWISGRREERRWVRESAVDAIVEFLDASHATSIACMEAHDEPVAGRETDLQPFRERARDAHNAQVHNLTRLMILSSPAVVEAAEAVHYVDHQLVNTTFGTPVPRPEDFDQINLELRPARDRLINVSRRVLHVRNPMHPTYPQRWWDVTSRSADGDTGAK